MKKLVSLVAILALAACQDALLPTAPSAASRLDASDAISAQWIPGRYIVVFDDDVADAPDLAREMVSENGGSLTHIYEHALKGFAAELSTEAIETLRAHPEVVHIERDGMMSINDTQDDATWGLDRVDQRDLPLDTQYSYERSGSGVNVYIIDTGIRTTHVQFGGRAAGVFSSIDDGNGANDCRGHGTHVAGTVGSTTYGVAKNVRLYAVRVLGCSGSGPTSGVIAGVDWVTANHTKPAVANMSLGGGASTALDQAVRNSIIAGVVYALSAGNSNADACLGSPSRTPEALTVASSTRLDARSGFSNFGGCVDLFAPGSSILSTYNGSDTQLATLSGTSMASPHVAGAAALYLEGSPGASPADVTGALVGNASGDRLSDIGDGSPNLLLYTKFIGGGGPGDAPPVARFTWSCNGLTCTFDGRGSSDDNGITSYAWDLGKFPDRFASGGVVTAVYPHEGQRTVILTVTDRVGQTNSVTQIITVGGSPADQPPVPSFTASCAGLTCNFNASGSTDDVGIVRYSWNLNKFPDGTAEGVTVSATYPHSGTRTVTLTVTDTGGQSRSTSRVVQLQ